jgi:hypothetical protein
MALLILFGMAGVFGLCVIVYALVEQRKAKHLSYI